MLVGFVSLGCAKNLVDTESMLGILADNDIKITDDPAKADILIVNTCSFIDSAKEESITTILQMAKYKKTGRCQGIIVAGCLGQRYRQELLDEMPEIDAVVGTSSWKRILEAVKEVQAGRRTLLIDEHPPQDDSGLSRIRTTPFYSAYVKIAEGCSNYCSYCVIPHVRGQLNSRNMESIATEVKTLVSQGVKEINLIAQDTTSYGKDRYGSPCLTELLKRLVRIDGDFHLRLLYCYPHDFTDELIDLIAAEEKIFNYVDLPLQHIHNDILRAMNRRDTRMDIEILLEKIRRRIPGVAIRTSFIVGFPGETDAHYATLKDFIQQQHFDHIGIFAYSREEGTPAYSLPGQIDEATKQERYHALMAIQSKISEERNQQLEGHVFSVLVEGHNEEQPDVAYGRSYREAPDIDGRIYVEKAGGYGPGSVVYAKIVQGFAYDLLAEIDDSYSDEKGGI